MKSHLLVFVCLLIIFVPAIAFGAEGGGSVIGGSGPLGPVPDFVPLVGIPGIDANEPGIGTYINAVYRLAISLAALLAVVKIVIAGAKYMLTDIVTGKEEAKQDIWGALMGLLIIIGAVVILNTINSDLTKTDVVVEPVTVNNTPIPDPNDPANNGKLIPTVRSASDVCHNAPINHQTCVPSYNCSDFLKTYQFTSYDQNLSCKELCTKFNGYYEAGTANLFDYCSYTIEDAGKYLQDTYVKILTDTNNCATDKQPCALRTCNQMSHGALSITWHSACQESCSTIGGKFVDGGQWVGDGLLNGYVPNTTTVCVYSQSSTGALDIKSDYPYYFKSNNHKIVSFGWDKSISGYILATFEDGGVDVIACSNIDSDNTPNSPCK